jgi:hypothetical protein
MRDRTVSQKRDAMMPEGSMNWHKNKSRLLDNEKMLEFVRLGFRPCQVDVRLRAAV